MRTRTRLRRTSSRPWKGEHHQRERADRHQGRYAAAANHAIIDFQHEQRAGELQQIDGSPEYADADQGMAAASECGGQFRTPLQRWSSPRATLSAGSYLEKPQLQVQQRCPGTCTSELICTGVRAELSQTLGRFTAGIGAVVRANSAHANTALVASGL